ncbi:KR-domain-containing protein [Xylariaceae sp. FL0662B]|nr:KR-domain-containing protein [Xylariaceae sp. FL0662B]
MAARRALHEVADADISSGPGHLRKYVSYLKHLCENEPGEGFEEADFRALLQSCEAQEPEWGLLIAVARALPSILCGETDPLELFFLTDLAKRFYTRLYNQHLRDEGLRTLLDLATHENPNMRILEIGSGTGGMTRVVLDLLRGFEGLTGQLRFAEYVFTDISPSFFESTRHEFSDFEDRMIFKTFDVARDPSEQGFAVGGYDLVVAGSVLHATPDLTATLANVRRLLKPRGILLFQEIVSPESAGANVVFGCLEGWWLGTEEWRLHSPLLDDQRWDELLRDTGLFSGAELVLRDYQNDEIHFSSVIVSFAIGRDTEETDAVDTRDLDERHNVVALVDPDMKQQRTLALALAEKFPGTRITDTMVVSFVEAGQPYLASIDEKGFKDLQNLIQRANNILWVTSLPCIDQLGVDPHCALAVGFLHSIRSKETGKKIVSLILRSGRPPGGEYEYISKVFNSCFFQKPALCDELEFVVRDGLLVIERACRVYPSLHHDVWEPKTGFETPVILEVGRSGMLDSLRFIEDNTHESELQSDEVELGYGCAGLVKRVGSRVSSGLRPNDRVVMACIGSMRSHPRAPSNAVVKLPDSLSLEDAASAITGLATAYHAQVNVAHLQRGEKILIHSAAGSTGQMAVQIAQNLGANIFATVGSDVKKLLIMCNFGVPEDHIFYSRDASFALGVKRVAGSVDVVLNSLSGNSLQASWECIAPYGRFIELGKADIIDNSSLPMARFAQNVAFAAVDLHHVALTNPDLNRSLLEKAIDLVARGEVKPPAPLHLYAVSEAENAFRYIQSGKNSGRTIITASPEDVVPKLTVYKKEWRFNEDASYLIAGGLGGIGCARSFILPSRSGASTQIARDFVSELRSKGLRVISPCCDLSSIHQLSTLLENYTNLPPIKGYINAAMALQDAVFENMIHAQWACTIQSKVQTSWNLHRLLPSDLNFFIMLSSLGGVYGSVAQSNYAAGCVFQDSLARSHTAAGFPASVSLDLGWMRTIGLVTKSDDVRRHQLHINGMQPVEAADFLALLDHYCDPELPLLGESQSQLLVRAVHPAYFQARGQTPIPLVSRPVFAGFSVMHSQQKERSAETGAQEDIALLFAQASDSKKDRASIVISAFKEKLARALWVQADDIDHRRSLSDYGVDSLMAVELRNWIRGDFRAAVAVFEIMGGASIAAVAELIVERTEA